MTDLTTSNPGRTLPGDDAIPVGLRRHLDHLVADRQRSWRSPTVSVGLARHGRLIWSAHRGSARLEPPSPADDDTQFMMGSITKTFTACLVMMLRDDGSVHLDQELGELVSGVHGAAARLSLRTLLSHTSGLQREPHGRLWESLDGPTADRLLEDLRHAAQVLPQRDLFHYSNLAYALLGQVVETVAGDTWEHVLTERLLGPLGLSSTALVPRDDRAVGYCIDPFAGTAVAEPTFDLRSAAPLGGLWTSVADLCRYGGFLAQPSRDILAPESVDEMCRPIVMADLDAWTSAYGLGLNTARRGDRLFVGHGGAMPGYLAGLRVRRPEGLCAVVLTNTGTRAEPALFATTLLEAVLDAEPLDAVLWTPEQEQPQLRRLLGSWWSEGEELVFEVRAGQLWSRLAGADPSGDSRFEQVDGSTYRVVEGRERGELLEFVVHPEDGTLERMYFATYPVTRAPQSFGAGDRARGQRGY